MENKHNIEVWDKPDEALAASREMISALLKKTIGEFLEDRGLGDYLELLYKLEAYLTLKLVPNLGN